MPRKYQSAGTSRRITGLAVFGVAALLLACGGGGTADEADGKTPAPPAELPPASQGCAADTGLAPLRRLTRVEYDNTVRDLLGYDAKLGVAFPPDEKLGPFDANVTSPVSELGLEDYLKAADQLSRRVVSDAKLLAAVLPCAAPTKGDAACAKSFIQSFGLRVYRRPLTPDEVARIQAVFTGGLSEGFTTGIRLALHMMLMSPHFLYHLEQGGMDQNGDVRVLSAFEVASRLSYFLWGSMPDQALFEAARKGELLLPATLQTQVQRMILDPRARESMRSFHSQWLGVTKLLDRDQFDNAIGPSAFEELLRIVDDVLWKGDGKLPALFTTRVSFVDAPLATLYGVAKPASGFQRADLNPAQRSGILTRVATLAAHSNPTARGKFVRSEILCQNVPPPPPDVDTALPPADPNLSPRARWEKHVTVPSCASCHRLMDPIGFGLSHYDELGKYITMDGRWPVDASGEIVGTKTSDGPFSGGIELSSRLAAAPELGLCVSHEMLVFALGRLTDPKRDRCGLDAIDKAFVESGYDMKALMAAIAGSSGFRVRRVSP